MITWCVNKLWIYLCSLAWWCLLPSLGIQAQEGPSLSLGRFSTGFPAYSHADSITISTWIQQGIRLRDVSKNDSALILFHKAYIYSRHTGYDYGVMLALHHTGGVLTHLGYIDSALAIYTNALKHAVRTPGMELFQSLLAGNIGNIHNFQGAYSKAARYYDSSLKIALKLKDHKSTAQTLSNLGGVYVRLNRPERALRYIEEGESICRKMGYTEDLSIALHNKGEAYLELNRLEEARKAFLEELAIVQKTKNKRGLILAHASMGTLALKEGNPQKALVHLQEAEQGIAPHNPYHAPVGIRADLGKAYYQLKQYGKAEYQLKMILEDAAVQGLKDHLTEVHQTLAAVYKATGRYREALAQQEQYEQLKDTQLSRERVKDINELEVKYRSAEKDKQLLKEQARLQEKDLRLRAKNFWIMGIALVTLLIGALFIAVYRSVRNRQKAVLKGEELKQLQALIEGGEKERSRIARELHDGIGGMLVAINMNLGMIKRNYPQAGLLKVEEMVDEASLEVRKTAHNLMPNILEKHHLKEALLLYCENMNENDGLQLQLQFDEALPVLDKGIELLLYRIVQELVQNIAKHAQATQAGIYIIKHEDRMAITAEDNGKGFDISVIKKGLGLDNIKYRVNTLKGEIHISSAKGVGTTVHIEFVLDELMVS